MPAAALGQALTVLRQATGADLAVVVRTGDGVGRVVCADPSIGDGPGGPWVGTVPQVAGTDPAVHRDPLELARLVPTTVRLQMPATPVAVVSAGLVAEGLALLLVWTGEDGSEAALPSLDLATLARLGGLAVAVHQATQAEADAARLGAVVGALSQAVVIVDDASGTAQLNAAAAELLALDEGEQPSRTVAEALRTLRSRSVDAEALERRASRLLTTPEAVVDGWVWRLDEPPRCLRVTSTPLRGRGVSGRVWVFDDISTEVALLDQEKAARVEAEQAQAALEDSEARYRNAVLQLRTTFDALADPALLLASVRDDRGRIVDFRCLEANAAACADGGLDRPFEKVVGGNLSGLDPEGFDLLVEGWGEIVETGTPIIQSAMVPPGGILPSWRRYDIRIVKAGDGLVVTWRDVTERWRTEQDLERRARHDDLTGLPNRAEVVARLVQRLAPGGPVVPEVGATRLAALFCDLDHFKQVNDTWGHAAGDAVLVAVGRAATASLRGGDTFARIGGDEFVALLDRVQDLDHAVVIAERLHQRLTTPVPWPGGPIPVGMSIGVVLAHPGEGPDELLARADEAMYAAKAAGRDRVIPIG